MSDKVKTITVLGSTGSVGRQVLAVVDKHRDRFKVVGLSAFSNETLLRDQIEKYSPKHYYFPAGGVEIQTTLFDFLEDDKFTSRCTKSLAELASFPADIVVSAVSGIAGLWAAVAVLERGGTLAIANKETIVCAGRHLKALEKKYGGKILPLDTEHSAIMQCLQGENHRSVKSVVLTASGGALRDVPVDRLPRMTAKDALAHPVWNMGKKITIDSATLFNKGLEVIEAMYLFSLPHDKVKVLMHRESVVHGMAEFDDKLNSILSNPDAMAQVASLAQSLGGGASQPSPPSSQEEPGAQPPPPAAETSSPDLGSLSSLLGQIDPATVQRLLPLMRDLNSPQDSQRRQFLYALRPYLKESRRDKVDRALQIARMLHLGKRFLGTLGDGHV